MINLKNVVVALVAIAGLAMMAPAAHAQRGGGAQGGGMMRMMQGGGNLFLLMRKDVQKDLGLKDEQVQKLESMQQDMMSQMRERAMSGGMSGDREAMMAELQKVMEDLTKKVESIITPEQKKRLGEIQIQMQGNRIALNPEYQEKLKLTSDQLAKMRSLQDKQRQASQALREKMQYGEIDREQMMEAQRKNQNAMDVELGKLLTAEQKKLIAEWGGNKKFQMDPNERGMMGIGG